MSGYELNSQWKEMESQGYTIKQVREKDPRGGAGRGQGRPARNVSTHSIKINQSVHEAISTQVARLRRSSGRSISIQDYLTERILKLEDWQAIAPEVRSWGEPWKHVTIEQAAYDRLQQIVEQVKAVRQDLYVNRSNVLCAIATMGTAR